MKKKDLKIKSMTEQIKHLKSMIEWINEAHGESVTTEYTGDKSPWSLKDYIEENMKDFEKIKIEWAKINSNANI